MNVQKQQKGFTIIEVVLVLAIAALIFLMIFVALPALQRGQRDTARKNDASAIASAINTYKSNNRGSLTDLDADDINENVSQVDVEVVGEGEGAPEGLDVANVYTSAICSGNGQEAVTTSSSRSAAVVIRLENGNASYCAAA